MTWVLLFAHILTTTSPKNAYYSITVCLTTDMTKVSAFFMEIAPFNFIETLNHILFTIEVSFIINALPWRKIKRN